MFLDEAEAALHKAVMRGEAWAVCFTLKTQGKGRGYTERLEVSKPTSHSVQMEEPMNWSLLSDEELEQVAQLIKKAQGVGQAVVIEHIC
ncbi:MAG: hypothetical protein D4R81_07615 [Nitrospiraceae bacterium]|nr:MAG: hypothetical protein D4R81_07615 [Nitrospiraceae bacterium]